MMYSLKHRMRPRKPDQVLGFESAEHQVHVVCCVFIPQLLHGTKAVMPSLVLILLHLHPEFKGKIQSRLDAVNMLRSCWPKSFE